MKDNCNDVKIYKDDVVSTAYIFSMDICSGKIRSYPNDDFEWHEPEEEYKDIFSGYLTLKEISDQFLKKYGGLPVLYVWIESAMAGTIYQIGNYSEVEWIKHGETKGYA